MFLDREPYIRVWRPIYRHFGPSIRRLKTSVLGDSVFPTPTPVKAPPSRALTNTELTELYSGIEQLLVNTAGDRQLTELLSVVEGRLRPSLTEAQLADVIETLRTELLVANAAKWSAMEPLLIAFLTHASNESVAVHIARKSLEAYRGLVGRDWTA